MRNILSPSDHVHDIIRQCVQTLYVLRAYCMCHAALHAIFQLITIAKLLYTSSTCIAFTKATDRQQVDVFLRRTIRNGYCPPDTPTFVEQCTTVDEELLNNICHNDNHVLYGLLTPPSTASQNYHLRARAHSQQLPQYSGHLIDCNFITCMLFTDICWALISLHRKWSINNSTFLSCFSVCLQLRYVNLYTKRLWINEWMRTWLHVLRQPVLSFITHIFVTSMNTYHKLLSLLLHTTIN